MTLLRTKLSINDVIMSRLFLGDTAALLSIGWSWKKVFLLQMLAQVPAFVGLYISIPVAESSTEAQHWFLVVAAGLFLYIALSDIVPELIEYFKAYHKVPMAICMNIGMLLGFAVLFVLAVFEEDFEV